MHIFWQKKLFIKLYCDLIIITFPVLVFWTALHCTFLHCIWCLNYNFCDREKLNSSLCLTYKFQKLDFCCFITKTWSILCFILVQKIIDNANYDYCIYFFKIVQHLNCTMFILRLSYLQNKTCSQVMCLIKLSKNLMQIRSI